MNARAFVTYGIVACGCLFLIFFLVLPVVLHSTYWMAYYEGFCARLSMDGDRVIAVITGDLRNGETHPPIYIRARGRDATAIEDIDERIIAGIAAELNWRVDHNSYRSHDLKPTYFEFADGRLSYGFINSDESPFEIGPSLNGPFVSLPVPVDEFLKIFGKPKKWTRKKRSLPTGMP